jgi:hypothetical protein
MMMLQSPRAAQTSLRQQRQNTQCEELHRIGTREDRDLIASLVQLSTPAVELDLMQPTRHVVARSAPDFVNR